MSLQSIPLELIASIWALAIISLLWIVFKQFSKALSARRSASQPKGKLMSKRLLAVFTLAAVTYFSATPVLNLYNGSETFQLMTQVMLGVFVAILLCITIFALIAPLYVPLGWLTNKPSKDGPSGIHFFTFIEPGKVKVVVKGDTVVRMVMDTGGKKFARKGGSRQNHEYWEIVDSLANESEYPLTDIVWWLRPWAWYVYQITGAVFTGIYPFQKVREYQLERTKISKREERDQADDIAVDSLDNESDGLVDNESNNVLTVVEDWSDHYRLRQFQYPMHVTQAETKDKIPLDILGVAEAEVRNPFKAAFGTDRWDRGIVNQVTDKINETTRTLGLDDALTATDAVDAQKISRSIIEITEDQEVIGIEITGFKLLEMDPVLSPAELKTIRAEALAIQTAKATRIDGKARADNLRELNNANAEGGEFALATLQAERDVGIAREAGKSGGTVFVSPNAAAPADPLSAAILAELKTMNKRSAP